MTEAKIFSFTAVVDGWRADVYKKAASMTDGDITVETIGTPGSEVAVLEGTRLRTVEVGKHQVAVEVNGPGSSYQSLLDNDAVLLRNINHDKRTRPTLVPFVWRTRMKRHRQERPLRQQARRRLG